MVKIIRDSDSTEYDFLRLEGQPQRSGVGVEPFERPGLDGVAFLKLGRRGRPFTLVGFRDFATLTDACQAGVDLIDAIKGQLCRILDSGQIEHPDMMCLDVRARQPVPVLKMVGGLGADAKAVGEFEMDFIYRK